MLILDGFANLAEIDTEDYTHSLMNLPHENYKVIFYFIFLSCKKKLQYITVLFLPRARKF